MARKLLIHESPKRRLGTFVDTAYFMVPFLLLVNRLSKFADLERGTLLSKSQLLRDRPAFFRSAS